MGNDGGAGGVADLGGDLAGRNALAEADGDVVAAAAVAGAVGKAQGFGGAADGFGDGAFGEGTAGAAGKIPWGFWIFGGVPGAVGGEALGEVGVDHGIGVDAFFAALEPQPAFFDIAGFAGTGVEAEAQEFGFARADEVLEKVGPADGLGGALGVVEEEGGEAVEFVAAGGGAFAAGFDEGAGMEPGASMVQIVDGEFAEEDAVVQDIGEGAAFLIDGAEAERAFAGDAAAAPEFVFEPVHDADVGGGHVAEVLDEPGATGGFGTGEIGGAGRAFAVGTIGGEVEGGEFAEGNFSGGRGQEFGVLEDGEAEGSGFEAFFGSAAGAGVFGAVAEVAAVVLVDAFADDALLQGGDLILLNLRFHKAVP